jgi:hypothetical protein
MALYLARNIPRIVFLRRPDATIGGSRRGHQGHLKMAPGQ